VQPPVYAPMLQAPLNWRLRRDEAPLQRGSGGRWEIDLDSFAQGLDEARALLFCNRHNPLGKVFTRAELGASPGYAWHAIP
jgi:cystathionine beta-lyase